MPDPRSRTAISSRSGDAGAKWSAEPARPAPPLLQPRNVLAPDGVSVVGRYGLCGQISAGGMASIHLGFMLGTAGFSRVVALKRMHPGLAQDPDFAARFKHEVMLGARVRHPNVVQALDVLDWQGELLLVMEFIHGENLAGLLKAASHAGEQLPLPVVLAVIASALHGLHAAHEAVDAEGAPLLLVHRDFSPQNVLIGSDGHARVLDFGVAKSSSQSVVTEAGHIAGKLPYLAPEQVRAEALDRRSDVFSVGVVLWEALTGARLFGGAETDSAATLLAVLSGPIAPPSEFRPIPAAIDRAVLRALNRDPALRFASAREFALELEATGAVAGPTTVAQCVQALCADRLQQLSDLQALASRALLSAQRSSTAGSTIARASDSAAEAGDTIVQSTASTLEAADPSAPPAICATPRRRAAGAIAALVLAIALGSLLSWPSKAQPAAVLVTPVEAPGSGTLAVTQQPVEAAPPAARSSQPAVEAAAPSAPAATRPSVAVPQAPRHSAAPICAQPTYLDERGIRHFKPQCL